MHDTDDSQDIPAVATTVRTIEEAVQISLKYASTTDSLFVFARALKAFEVTTKGKLSRAELPAVFVTWWNRAKPLLPPDADFDEWKLNFLATFAETRAPLGSNLLHEAIRRAKASPPPHQALSYENPQIRHLIAVCYQLQKLRVDSPIILSVRNAAEILGLNPAHRPDLDRANKVLKGLEQAGILTLVKEGDRAKRLARRYQFN
jgi:hypothetical protein